MLLLPFLWKWCGPSGPSHRQPSPCPVGSVVASKWHLTGKTCGDAGCEEPSQELPLFLTHWLGQTTLSLSTCHFGKPVYVFIPYASTSKVFGLSVSGFLQGPRHTAVTHFKIVLPLDSGFNSGVSLRRLIRQPVWWVGFVITLETIFLIKNKHWYYTCEMAFSCMAYKLYILKSFSKLFCNGSRDRARLIVSKYGCFEDQQ